MPKHSSIKKINTRGKLVFGAAGTVLILLLLLAVSYLGRGTVELTLKGERDLYLSYGQEQYEEPGAEAVYKGRLFTANVALPVTVEGQPGRHAVPGVYTVTYTASWHGRTSATETRTVTIRDITPPDIILISDPEHLTEAGEAYQEEGYLAYDQFDGDITVQVIRREGSDGYVYYTVTDSSGNRAEVKREIRYHDTAAPSIQLNGSSEMNLRVGDSFEDPGAQASDNAEGDISGKILVSGSVDTEKEGVYTLIYTVSDRAGNTAEIKRTVTVLPAPSVDPP